MRVAAMHGRSDVVRTLLKKGTNVNEKTTGGYTALHVAAILGSHDIVRMLLDKGADVNAKDYVGNVTALSEAIRKGRQAVATLLRNAGAHR